VLVYIKLYLVDLIFLFGFIELQNRKILEELQLKKQMLLKQGVAPTLNSSLGVSSTGSVSNIVSIFYQLFFVSRTVCFFFILFIVNIFSYFINIFFY
jgi:hypothetical protein